MRSSATGNAKLQMPLNLINSSFRESHSRKPLRQKGLMVPSPQKSIRSIYKRDLHAHIPRSSSRDLRNIPSQILRRGIIPASYLSYGKELSGCGSIRQERRGSEETDCVIVDGFERLRFSCSDDIVVPVPCYVDAAFFEGFGEVGGAVETLFFSGYGGEYHCCCWA